MSKPTLETFDQALACPNLRRQVPAVARLSARELRALWETSLANGGAWSKEKIFAAGVALALSLQEAPK